jgi:hypothetical protein
MDKLLRFGIEPVGGTPAQFSTMLASESAKWKKNHHRAQDHLGMT